MRKEQRVQAPPPDRDERRVCRKCSDAASTQLWHVLPSKTPKKGEPDVSIRYYPIYPSTQAAKALAGSGAAQWPRVAVGKPPIDLEERARERESRAPQMPYVYYQNF